MPSLSNLLAILKDVKRQNKGVIFPVTIENPVCVGMDIIIDAIEQMEDSIVFKEIKVDLNNNYLGLTETGSVYIMEANGPKTWEEL